MFDFKKLSDPAFLAEQAAKRDAEEAAREAVRKRQNEQLQRCLDHYDSLPEKERSFVLSCRARAGLWLDLTEKQSKWLEDIASRLAKQQGAAS